LLWLALLAGLTLFGQDRKPAVYEPKIGQKGKDVVWVPTPTELVDKMLELAEVKAEDFVIDLGSGDGRTVISAARLGAKAEGVEFNHDMIVLSRENARREGVSDKVEFIEGDMFEADLSHATVITLFLLPGLNIKLRPKLLELRPGTRVVSNTFTMNDWVPDSTVTTPENWNSWNTAFMWIIPARVDGLWKSSDSEISFSQKYQIVGGLLTRDGRSYPVDNGRIRGNQISFMVDGSRYSGEIDGDLIKGTVEVPKEGTKAEFTAKRLASRP